MLRPVRRGRRDAFVVKCTAMKRDLVERRSVFVLFLCFGFSFALDGESRESHVDILPAITVRPIGQQPLLGIVARLSKLGEEKKKSRPEYRKTKAAVKNRITIKYGRVTFNGSIF